MRKIIFPPFEKFRVSLEIIISSRRRTSRRSFARALVRFECRANLGTLGVRRGKIRKPKFAVRIHSTVWEQMNAWLDNLALAFPREPLSLRDWLPILEAGLAT